MRRPESTTFAFLLLAAAIAAPARAEDDSQGPSADKPGEEKGGGQEGGADKDLAKAVQNPVADLISVPFQNNTVYNIGPFDRAQNTLDIEPVVPLHVSERINLITRTILPIVYQPDVTTASGGTTGVGDLNPSLFLSPAKPGKLIWGIGPTFLIPTATQRVTGTGKFGVGPAAVVLVQPDPWTLGVLATQIWSVAGPSDRSSVSALSIQYFVNYNLPHTWYLLSQPIITANFKAPGGGTAWTVPFGAGFGKIFRLGKQPLNGQLEGYYNARTSDDTIGGWQMRAQLSFLFPLEKPKKAQEEKKESEQAHAGHLGAPGAGLATATAPARPAPLVGPGRAQ